MGQLGSMTRNAALKVISIKLCNIMLKNFVNSDFMYYTDTKHISGLSIIITVLSIVQYMEMTCANTHR